MKRVVLVAAMFLAACVQKPSEESSPYGFEGKISREVLENYLDRSVTLQSLLVERGASFEDNLRMIENAGIKFVGRAVCQWAEEDKMLANFELERELIPRVHAVDPEVVLQACIFEIVSPAVDSVPVPEWCFREMGLPVEERNYRYADMLYPDGQFVGHWNGRSSVPDISRDETKLYFLYQAATYIDMGIEAIHFGQVELMNKNDRELHHYAGLLAKIREYAAEHARRGMIICDAHVPGGGFLYDGDYLLMDFHSFPLRIKEESAMPQHASLEVGYTDALYLRSRGGRTYSGWSCESLPYLVEFDNYGGSGHPNEPRTERGGFVWIWGYDEISWLANQPDDYRREWIRYAYDWVAKNDPNGWLQMPAGRQTTGIEGRRWYSAVDKTEASPDGMGDENTIRDIWRTGRTAHRTVK
jgi:hypothetical protein